MRDNKEKSRKQCGNSGNGSYITIVTHPAQFCKKLSEQRKQDAINEYKAILQSNALSPLAAWYRQTKHKAVKNELEDYFRQAVRNEAMLL